MNEVKGGKRRTAAAFVVRARQVYFVCAGEAQMITLIHHRSRSQHVLAIFDQQYTRYGLIIRLP